MRTLLLFLLGALACQGQTGLRSPAFVASLHPFPSFFVTNNAALWFDFENMSAMSTSQMETNDHNEGINGNTLISDATPNMKFNSSMQKTTVNYFKGGTDANAAIGTGTNGLEISLTNGATTFVRIAHASTGQSSIGGWVFCPTMPSDTTAMILAIQDSGSSSRAQMGWRLLTGSYDIRYETSGGAKSIGVGVLPDNWYFFAMQFSRSSLGTNCQFAAYDANGNLIGSIGESTTSDAVVDRARFGNVSAITSACLFGLDNFIISTNGSAWPIYP